MARNRVWNASTLVGLEVPVARDHGSLFHHGSLRGPGLVAGDQTAPHQVRSLPVHTVSRKKVVVFRANSVEVSVRVRGRVVQVEKAALGVGYMLTAS